MSALNITLTAALITGLLCVAISIFVIRKFEKTRMYDHLARTLVSIAVGLISIAVAFWFFELNSARLRDQETKVADEARFVIYQNFRKAALQFSFAAYQLRSMRLYCGISPIDEGYDRRICQESARLAIRAAGILPGVDFIFNQAIKGSQRFTSSNQVATLIVDGDLALRGRMPSVIETYLSAHTGSSGSRLSSAARLRFQSAIADLQNVGEAMGSMFCLFTYRTNQGWADFDSALELLERSFSAEAGEQHYETIMKIVAGISIGDIECANVRANLEKVLPGGGGGNGGGGD